MGEAGGGEYLTVASALNELLLKRGYLAIQQKIRLVDKADEGIGPDGGVRVVQSAGIERIALGI